MAKSKSKAASCDHAEMDRKWKIEADLRTLRDAAAIKKDAARLAAAKAEAKRQMDELTSLTK